jgi:hypothetical protein
MTGVTFDFDYTLKCYVKLFDEERAIRGQRLGLANLDKVIDCQRKLISAGASHLPAKGPGADRLIRALASKDDVEAVLALRLIFKLKPFPQNFVRPVVRHLILNRRETWLRNVSEMHGWRPVFDEIHTMATEGLISEKFFLFLKYYVGWSVKDGSPEAWEVERTSMQQRILSEIRRRESSGGVLPWIDRKVSKMPESPS